MKSKRGRDALMSTKASKAKPAKAAAATKPALRAPPPKERCFFPSRAENAFELARKAVEKRFEVFASTPDSVSFRWRHTPTAAGPDFRLERSTRADATRSMRAGQKMILANQEPRFVTFLALAFHDLDEVLDEINGLIEAQRVILSASGGPIFTAWNKMLTTATGDEVGWLTKL